MARSPDRFSMRLRWEDLNPNALRVTVERARSEDLTGFGLRTIPAYQGDVTSRLLPLHGRGKALLKAREKMVVSGLPLVAIVLDVYGGGEFKPKVRDGEWVDAGQTLGSLEGPLTTILEAERILLNFVQHLSGIATLTHKYVDKLGDSPTRLLDTRKTTPGFRVLEKYAVASGGGWNHRMGLFDRVMIKDNHVAALQADDPEAFKLLVSKARKAYPDLGIEVEIDHLDQIEPAISGGADILLLDNMSPGKIQHAMEMINDRVLTEASGRINFKSIQEYAQLGLNFISIGAIIHQATWLDLALDWTPDNPQ